MTKIAKKSRVSKKLKSSDVINKEVSAGDFIPYSRHLDNHTIKTHSGALLQFMRIGGVSFETKDQAELNRLQEKRNMLFYGISDSRFAIWTTLVRRKESRFPSGNFEETGFAKSLNDKYKRRISSSSMFVNELYLTIIRQPPSGGINKFSDFLKSLSQKGDVALQKKEEQEAVSKLNEVTQKILTNLDDYAPTLLGLKETKNGIVSEPLAFLGYLVNGEKKTFCCLFLVSIDNYQIHGLFLVKRRCRSRGCHKINC